MCALDGGVCSSGLERRHGVSAVSDEKYSPAMELVGYLLVWLPRRSLDDLEIDLFADGLGEHFGAILRGELRRGLPFAGEVRGDEHAKVVLGHQEYAVDLWIFDLHGIAIAQVRDESPPGGAEVDEHDEDRQCSVSRRCDTERFPDPAVHAVRGDQIGGPDRLGLTGAQIAKHRRHAGIVLLERAQFRPISRFAATPAGFGEQHRLEAALRAVLHGRLRAQLIQAGEKRVDVNGQLFFRAVQRRLDDHV